MEAITSDGENPSVVNAEMCIGCGICAANCPSESIKLVEVREEVFIPKKP
jgi:Pyruvate/2-oxoacid:ferredoxin oxidoreductase delta subunit